MKILICFFLILYSASVIAAPSEQLEVNVNPGIELFTIIQLLAGKYPAPTPSLYSQEVMSYFSQYKNHPAVVKVVNFKKVYTDLPELGCCFSNFPEISICEPITISWYTLYGKTNILEYMRLCREFSRDSHFWQFYNLHQKRYKQWGLTLKVKIDSQQLVQKLQGFYKYNVGVQWNICIDPLNSWGAHTILMSELNPEFSKCLVHTTGYFNPDGDIDKDPVFEYRNFAYLAWHEGSHFYTDSLQKKYAAQINSLSYLFANSDAEGMKRAEIKTWAHCFDETLVRAITCALYKKYRPENEYKKQLSGDIAQDFIYVEDLNLFISEKYVNTKRYKNFASFFPDLLNYLKKKYPEQIRH